MSFSLVVGKVISSITSFTMLFGIWLQVLVRSYHFHMGKFLLAVLDSTSILTLHLQFHFEVYLLHMQIST